MKLSEALAIRNRAPAAAPAYEAALACGFTPLHLQTCLGAHLQLRLPEKNVRVTTGNYGDLPGTLTAVTAADAAAVVLEWADLDPRLGIRQCGGWTAAVRADIAVTAAARAALLRDGLAQLAGRCAVALCLPTLPLPPAAPTPGRQADALAARLDGLLAELRAWACAQPSIRLLNGARLDRLSPPAGRFDVKAELAVGFPYRLAHADALAALLAELLVNPLPKKGLITDLDDTLWHGILGEAGVSGVAWDLAHHAQMHGLYQQVLASLAETGILVGVATKNDPALVEEVFRRPGLLLRREQVFPVAAHWGAKSESVRAILQTWNIAADSVVFVDDSPMELAEVAAAHPGLECRRFPGDAPDRAYALLEELRDLFGKAGVSEEDSLRLESLRQADTVRVALAAAPDGFLASCEARLRFEFDDAADGRALELVNKTNQFNLNGRRFSESEWRRSAARPGAFTATVAYRDKFGLLGKIAVIAGVREGGGAAIETWVMSCRAFGRRIEHQCLRQIFERFGAAALTFDYCAAPRNAPLRDFLEALLGQPPAPGARLAREQFDRRCPPLFHSLEETAHV